ncbi:MAG: phosphoribosylamine--glycine ligase [Candidatus Micrarchaeota archaeon]|nr:phosphoribosylamine--glycine ligase [Candidatus Micrarchaeota archaeon]
MERFLLVGNGAREHSIAEAICKSEKVRLFAFMSAKNPGIMRLAKNSGGEYAVGDIHSPGQVLDFAKRHSITLAFPSPDAVLAAGVSDELLKAGISCAAPTKKAARLEWDKAYCRELLQEFKVPGLPKFGAFESPAEASSFIDSLGGKVAVKPAGLTGGKGVKVVGFQLKDGEEAKAYAKELLVARHSGLEKVVVEERLEGEEFSLQAFCDGKRVYGMPLVQDHKRAYEGDVGPNTGGMGSYSGAGSLLPFTRQQHYDRALEIMQKSIEAFYKSTGERFVGILYGGFILTKDGPKLLEYNARFGDPEAMNVLGALKGELIGILFQMADGKIAAQPSFFKKASVCKYLVPEGYPGKSVANQPLQIDMEKISSLGARLYFASVNEEGGTIYTQSSRSVAILGLAGSIFEAEKIAEAGCSAVKGRVWHRSDIGTEKLIQRRIEHMKALGAI